MKKMTDVKDDLEEIEHQAIWRACQVFHTIKRNINSSSTDSIRENLNTIFPIKSAPFCSIKDTLKSANSEIKNEDLQHAF